MITSVAFSGKTTKKTLTVNNKQKFFSYENFQVFGISVKRFVNIVRPGREGKLDCWIELLIFHIQILQEVGILPAPQQQWNVLYYNKKSKEHDIGGHTKPKQNSVCKSSRCIQYWLHLFVSFFQLNFDPYFGIVDYNVAWHLSIVMFLNE